MYCHLSEIVITNDNRNDYIFFNECNHGYLKDKIENWFELNEEKLDNTIETYNENCMICNLYSHIKPLFSDECWKKIIIPANDSIIIAKPYIPSDFLNKKCKNNIINDLNHGDIIYNGIDYFICKVNENNKRKIIYLEDHDEFMYFNNNRILTDTYYTIPYEYICAYGIQYYIDKYKDLKYPLLLSLNKKSDIYYDLISNDFYPKPRETNSDNFVDINSDDEDEDESKDETKDEAEDESEGDDKKDPKINFGKMKYDVENDQYLIYTKQKKWVLLYDPSLNEDNTFISSYYVDLRGIGYYRWIAKDNMIPIYIQISPLEMMNLMDLSIIKANIT